MNTGIQKLFALCLAGAALGCGGANEPAVPLTPQFTPEQIAAARAELRESVAPRNNWPTITQPEMFREWSVAETAADALARIGPEAVPALIEALKDDNPIVRSNAARGLARMGPEAAAAVPALTAALEDSDLTVRRNAARALGQIGTAAKSAVPELVATLKEDAPNVVADRGTADDLPAVEPRPAP